MRRQGQNVSRLSDVRILKSKIEPLTCSWSTRENYWMNCGAKPSEADCRHRPCIETWRPYPFWQPASIVNRQTWDRLRVGCENWQITENEKGNTRNLIFKNYNPQCRYENDIALASIGSLIEKCSEWRDLCKMWNDSRARKEMERMTKPDASSKLTSATSSDRMIPRIQHGRRQQTSRILRCMHNELSRSVTTIKPRILYIYISECVCVNI